MPGTGQREIYFLVVVFCSTGSGSSWACRCGCTAPHRKPRLFTRVGCCRSSSGAYRLPVWRCAWSQDPVARSHLGRGITVLCRCQILSRWADNSKSYRSMVVRCRRPSETYCARSRDLASRSAHRSITCRDRHPPRKSRPGTAMRLLLVQCSSQGEAAPARDGRSSGKGRARGQDERSRLYPASVRQRNYAGRSACVDLVNTSPIPEPPNCCGRTICTVRVRRKLAVPFRGKMLRVFHIFVFNIYLGEPRAAGAKYGAGDGGNRRLLAR